jgi:hypothetical protein
VTIGGVPLPPQLFLTMGHNGFLDSGMDIFTTTAPHYIWSIVDFYMVAYMDILKQL